MGQGTDLGLARSLSHALQDLDLHRTADACTLKELQLWYP